MGHSLSVKGLRASYRGRPVLSGLSFIANAGELTALLGRNGSGKTTLLRAIGGVLRPDEGQVRLEDCDFLRLSRTELARRVAYVPQLASPPAHLSVAEAVRLCARGIDAAQAAVAMLRLEPLAAKRCDEVSGGEWRRVLVAQGLAQLPQSRGVLLLDEPLAYVDAAGRRELLALLRQFAVEREAVCLLAMHEIELGAEYCGAAVLLKDGRTYAEGDFGTVAGQAAAPALELIAEVA